MATGELVTAILAGDLAAVQALFDEKSDLIEINADEVEYKDADGVDISLNKPIISAAIQGGNTDIVKLLLEKGADVNKFDTGLEPPGPIFFITEYSNPKISEEIAMLVFEHANMNLKNSKGQTILYEAQLRSADYAAEIVKRFGVNIAERDIMGHTVVDEVLFHDMYQLMPVYQTYVLGLIQNNDVNTIRNLVLDGFEYVMQGGGVSALDIARSSGAEDMATFIETVPTLMDTIPTLHSAIGSGNLEGTQAIITSHLATAKDSGGRCSLHIAIMCEQEQLVKYLVENFPDTLKITDAYHRTPLHYAAAVTNEEIYSVLVTAGADEDVKECCNLTPKDYRTEFANPGSRSTMVDVQNMIEKERSAKYGIKVYLKLQYQALLQAIEANNTAVAQDLIDNLAFDIEDFVREGVANIPLLFVCVEKGAEDIALYLLTKGADPKIQYNNVSLQDAAFKAKMPGLYHTLAEVLGFKERRLSAFSETSSMMSDKITMPTRPPPMEAKAPEGLTGFDSQYLGRVLGSALTGALSELCDKRPWDPIEFLAQWLYKYKDNQIELNKKKEEEYQIEVQKAEAEKQAIRDKRHKKEAKHLRMLEAERQKKIDEENRIKAEEEQKRKELEELRNKQRETDQLAQPPDLDTVKEDDEPATQQAPQVTVTDGEEAGQQQDDAAAEEQQAAAEDGGGEEHVHQDEQQAPEGGDDQQAEE